MKIEIENSESFKSESSSSEYKNLSGKLNIFLRKSNSAGLLPNDELHTWVSEVAKKEPVTKLKEYNKNPFSKAFISVYVSDLFEEYDDEIEEDDLISSIASFSNVTEKVAKKIASAWLKDHYS